MIEYEPSFNKRFFSKLKSNQSELWVQKLFQKILKQKSLTNIRFYDFNTSDGKIPDCLMETDEAVCVIENKTLASTSSDQLINYSKSLLNDFSQDNKFLLLLAPPFNQIDIAIADFKESGYYHKIKFLRLTLEEFFGSLKGVKSPKEFNDLVLSNSKLIAYKTYDKLFKPIFDELCNTGFLREDHMPIRTETGATKYYQYRYFYKNTLDRLRIGFNKNQISEFTIAWYSVNYNNKNWTMGTKLKGETEGQVDVFEKLYPIKDVAINYPFFHYVGKTELLKQDKESFKERFTSDIINLHSQIEMYKSN